MLSVGGLMRYTRTNMLEVLNSDYIRTARQRSFGKVVINKHAFRNTMIPFGVVYELSFAFHVRSVNDNRNALPDSRHWVRFLPGNYSWRYSLRHVLYNSLIVLTQVSLLLADIMYAVVDPASELTNGGGA